MLPTARDRQERSLLLIQTLADLLGDLSPSVLGRRAMERAAGSANHHSPAVVGPFLHCRSSPAPPPPTGVGAGHDLIQGVSEQVTHHQHHHTGCWLAQTREQQSLTWEREEETRAGNVFTQVYHWSHHVVQPHPTRLWQLKDPEETIPCCQDMLLSSMDREFLFPGNKGKQLSKNLLVYDLLFIGASLIKAPTSINHPKVRA